MRYSVEEVFAGMVVSSDEREQHRPLGQVLPQGVEENRSVRLELMSITGTKQGLITAGAFTEDSVGNTYQEGHEDQVMVQGFNHEVIIPRDPQSGQPTGQRVHKPVVITKVFDKASPLLLAALTSGERLTKVEIQWYRTSAAGTQEHYYTTVLEDAIIVDIKDYMHNCQDPGNAHFTHLEDVHFTYRKITWTHEVSGTSGSDDWRSPVAG